MDPEEMQAKSERVQRMVEEAELEVTSEKKEVSIMMGPAGSIKELELSHRALRLSGQELGTMIVETLKRGREELDTQLNKEISSVFGLDSTDDFLGGGFPNVDDLVEKNQSEEKK